MLYGAEEIVFRKFGGGLVLDVDPTEIGDDQASDASNVDFEDETLSKRKGRVAYNAAVEDAEGVLGLHRYYPRDGETGFCLAAMRLSDGGTDIYEDDGDGNFVAALDAPLDGETPVDFVGWKERVYAGNGVDALQRRKATGEWTAVELLDTPAEAPVLSLARAALETFDSNETGSGVWSLAGAALTTTNEATLKREGSNCLKFKATGAGARGSHVHRNWSSAQLLTTALGANVTSGATSMSVGSVTGLEVGDHLQIQDEVVKVTSITPPSTLGIARAQGGTTAAAHNMPLTVTRSTLDLSKAEYVSLWIYSEKLDLVFQVGVKDNTGLLDFSKFPTYSTQQKETWVRIRVPLTSIPPAERTASPGLGIKFVERPTSVTTWNISIYFDEARPEGPLVPDHYYYYSTYAETQEINGREVVVRESNPSTAGEIDVPVDDAALGVSVQVGGVADTVNYNQIMVYRRRRDGPFTQARLVKTLDNPGATTTSFSDTLGDDEIAIADAAELVAGKIDPPIAKTYAVANARLAAGHVYLDTTGDGDADLWYPWRLYLSRLGYPEEFGGGQEPTDPNAPGWLDIANRDHILRLVEFDGQLIVFCDRAIYTLEGSGWDDFAFRKRADVGLDARNAVLPYDRLLFFLASDGVRVLAPNRSQDGLFETWVVSEPVDSRLRAIPAEHRSTTTFGEDERGRLHISLVRSGQTTADAALVFDPTAPNALAPGATANRRGWSSYSNWGFSCFHTLKRGGGDAGQLLGGDPANGKLHYLQRDGSDIALESDHTVLVGGISAGATSLLVESAGGIQTGSVLLVDSERMLVTGVSGSDVDVTRGHAGTTAASHADEADIYCSIPWQWRGKAVDGGPGRTVEYVYVGGEFDAATGTAVTATPVLDGLPAATAYILALGSASTGFVAALQRCGARIRGRFAALQLAGSQSVAMKCRSARIGHYLR